MGSQLRTPSVGTRGNSPRSHKHFKCQFECQPGAVGLCGLSCQPPLVCPHTLGGPLSHKDTQGCHHQTGSMFSLLVSSAPQALRGAPAPTPGAPGPGSLGRPLSAFHPKPISHEGLGRDSVVCPKTGGFSQKILPWRRGNAWARASSPHLGDIAAGELGGRREPPVQTA